MRNRPTPAARTATSGLRLLEGYVAADEGIRRLSGMFFPLAAMPHLMQWTAEALPITPLVNAMRAVALDGAALGDSASTSRSSSSGCPSRSCSSA